MKFINFAIVKFSVFLVFGILAAHFFPIDTFILKYLLALLLAVFILWLWARNRLIQNVFFGIAVYMCFFAIGYFSYQIRLPQFRLSHYTHLATDNTAKLLHLKIIQPLKPDRFNIKYIARVKAVNGEPSEGKILLYIAKDSLSQLFAPDDILLVYALISEIAAPLNPHQFSYSEYMKSLGVYAQLKVSEKNILKTREGSKTIMGFAQKLRAQIIEKLKKTKLKKDERAIIQALVLGERKEIDKELYREYAATGTVHILAVSGLHVGVFYIILAFLFRPLKRGKYGTLIHLLLIVLLLWGFALLSGLSPSVSRAVTMFSLFAVAKLFNRDTNTLNTLFLSFFLLLVINPLWLFQVGFQLSYLAVFFIVWLQPLFYKITYTKYGVLRKVWTIASVTLCAQIGVLPFSLYYFHQIPGLFLLANIVVLPFLTLLMCGGILIVLLAFLEMLPDWFAESYNFLIEMLNGFIHWVAGKENFLITDIHFSTLKVLGTYFLIVALALFLKKRNYRRLVVSLSAILILIAIYINAEFRTSANKLVIFQKNRKTLMGYKNGMDFTVFRKDTSTDISEKYPIKSFKTAMNIDTYHEEKLPKLFRYNHKNIYILDSFGLLPKQLKIQILLLTNSPKVNLNRVIERTNPEQIIADGSNYYSYVKRWKSTCRSKKIPFSHTAKRGAFVIE